MEGNPLRVCGPSGPGSMLRPTPPPQPQPLCWLETAPSWVVKRAEGQSFPLGLQKLSWLAQPGHRACTEGLGGNGGAKHLLAGLWTWDKTQLQA